MLGIITSMILIILLVSIFIFIMSIRPFRIISDVTPKNYGLDYEKTTVTTADNLKLSAWYIPAKAESKKTLIVMHGYPADKGDALSTVLFLHKKYNLFLFDFRYFGESEGNHTSIGYKETRDLEATIKHIKKRFPDHKLGIYAYSLGAITTILNETNDVQAIVLDSLVENVHALVDLKFKPLSIFRFPFVWTVEAMACLTFGTCPINMSLTDSVSKIHTPLFFIQGAKDSMMPSAGAKKVFNKANEPKEWWAVEKAEHIQSHFVASEEYERRVLEFYEKWI